MFGCKEIREGFRTAQLHSSLVIQDLILHILCTYTRWVPIKRNLWPHISTLWTVQYRGNRSYIHLCFYSTEDSYFTWRGSKFWFFTFLTTISSFSFGGWIIVRQTKETKAYAKWMKCNVSDCLNVAPADNYLVKLHSLHMTDWRLFFCLNMKTLYMLSWSELGYSAFLFFFFNSWRFSFRCIVGSFWPGVF